MLLQFGLPHTRLFFPTNYRLLVKSCTSILFYVQIGHRLLSVVAVPYMDIEQVSLIYRIFSRGISKSENNARQTDRRHHNISTGHIHSPDGSSVYPAQRITGTFRWWGTPQTRETQVFVYICWSADTTPRDKDCMYFCICRSVTNKLRVSTWTGAEEYCRAEAMGVILGVVDSMIVETK